MALQTFSLDAVQKVSQHIRQKLVLPPSEQQPSADQNLGASDFPEPSTLDALGDLFRVGGFAEEAVPAPNSEGRWFISTIDPAAVLYKLPGLQLKPKVRLVTYLQRQPQGGIGVTWALPELMSTTEQLEQALTDSLNSGAPPHPQGALGHVMEGVEGNSSAASYIAASLLMREYKELGRTGPFRRWSQHRLLDRIPSQQPWQWRSKPPQDLSPKVKVLEDQSVLVEFFSCRVVKPVALFRHLDQYHRRSYRPKSHDQVIALREAIAVPQPSASR
ncbi:MAG: hypothetical protein O3C67_11380 [Cyanobacteria bacterium]|nr:hypothetical protein [Cyanobacteriota bacterium]MEB3269942.1 hypothetical protein [Leptolyngbya sp.]